MDAKPQRPVRTLRVRGDENVPPLHDRKTLHQRNKSTPALSTLVGQGGLKNAAKRTAFGDVSNTVNTSSRSTKDDSSISCKGTTLLLEKPAPPSRPAQRPVPAAAVKGCVNTTVTAANANLNSRHGVLEKLPGNSRKVPNKQNNTVFKDPVLHHVAEAGSISAHQTELPSDSNTSTADVATEPPEIAAVNIAPSLKPAESVKLQDTLKPHVGFSDPVGSDEYPPLRSDGVHIGDSCDIQVSGNNPQGNWVKAESRLSLKEMPPAVCGSVKVEVISAPDAVLKMPGEVATGGRVRYDHGPTPSEPEDYWDDEDEDNYGDDGYVTARSHRSRSDNTTGGATVILFPKVTQKVKRELAIAKQVVEATRTVEEMEDESWDTTMVAEYGDEIFQYMREMELKLLPNAHYMDNQAEIRWSMRSVLMDWLVQVHHRFSLLPETLFLCVNYIDRFLSCKIVSLGKLQLVGATAIFIAAKYEEINCPSLQEIVYMVDNGYKADEILKAERFMLSMLQFELGWPGPMSFLRRISKADDYDLETRTLAKYFLEITIMDERFVGSPPSFTAAGAHCLARLMLRKGIWTPAHVYYSNYTYSQLYPLALLIFECCENPEKHHPAVYEKYTDRRFKRASYFVEGEMLKGFQLPEPHKEGSAAHLIALFDNVSSWRQ